MELLTSPADGLLRPGHTYPAHRVRPRRQRTRAVRDSRPSQVPRPRAAVRRDGAGRHEVAGEVYFQEDIVLKEEDPGMATRGRASGAGFLPAHSPSGGGASRRGERQRRPRSSHPRVRQLGLQAAERRPDRPRRRRRLQVRGLIGFSLQEASLEASSASLDFDRVNVGIRDLFGLPLDFSFFIGGNDVLCRGDAFPVVFGTVPIGTTYRGLMYFPDLTLSTVYNGGIHAVRGTGIKVDVSPKRDVIASPSTATRTPPTRSAGLSATSPATCDSWGASAPWPSKDSPERPTRPPPPWATTGAA